MDGNSGFNTQYKIVLLVIDVQQGLFERPRPIYQAEAFLANLQTLIERARQAAVEVIFVQHANDGFLQPDTPAWQLYPAIQPREGDSVIHPACGSCGED
jgi:nicotinamidase-related amidase